MILYYKVKLTITDAQLLFVHPEEYAIYIYVCVCVHLIHIYCDVQSTKQ
jgi:hypothetical protein